MATATTYNKAALDVMFSGTVVSAAVDGTGNLILTRFDGTTVNCGSVVGDFLGGTLQQYLAPAVKTLTDASVVLVNAAQGNVMRLLTTSAVGSSRTMGAPANSVDGEAITFEIQQASSGGPYFVTWGSAYSFGSDGVPTLSSTAGKVDAVSFRYNASLSKWLCGGWKLGF